MSAKFPRGEGGGQTHSQPSVYFREPKNVEIPKILGVRVVVADSSNNFLLTLQDTLNPDLSLI